MSTEAMPSGPPSLRRWVTATTLGWLLGFVLLVALAIAFEQVSGGATAQFMIGVGMGAGVGVMQARALRAWLESTWTWILATTVSMGLPFILWDLWGVVWGVQAPFGLLECVIGGSVLAGVLQSALLRHRLNRTSWWVLASLLGWGLPAVALPDRLLILWILLGGTILGAVTGPVLLSLPQRPAV